MRYHRIYRLHRPVSLVVLCKYRATNSLILSWNTFIERVHFKVYCRIFFLTVKCTFKNMKIIIVITKMCDKMMAILEYTLEMIIMLDM